ncbi:MAG TPA: hypothetical protein VGF17_05520, partial [Phytomonospora sp.]
FAASGRRVAFDRNQPRRLAGAKAAVASPPTSPSAGVAVEGAKPPDDKAPADPPHVRRCEQPEGGRHTDDANNAER